MVKNVYAQKWCGGIVGERIIGTIKSLLCTILLCLAFLPTADAYTTVLISTAAPVGLEKAFLANSTNYLIGNIVPNPFAANTYQLTLYGLNPNYVAPTSVALDTTTWVDTILTVSSDTYVNGFANGLTAQVYNEIGVQNGFFSLCQSTDTFYVQGSTFIYDTAISSTTCEEVLHALSFSTYQLLYGN